MPGLKASAVAKKRFSIIIYFGTWYSVFTILWKGGPVGPQGGHLLSSARACLKSLLKAMTCHVGEGVPREVIINSFCLSAGVGRVSFFVFEGATDFLAALSWAPVFPVLQITTVSYI